MSLLNRDVVHGMVASVIATTVLEDMCVMMVNIVQHVLVVGISHLLHVLYFPLMTAFLVLVSAIMVMYRMVVDVFQKINTVKTAMVGTLGIIL